MTDLVLLAFLAAFGASPSGAEAAAPLRGRVVDARTGQPVEKARVWMPANETVTDRDGRFALPRPQAGTEIAVSAVGCGVARRTLADGPLRSVQAMPGVSATTTTTPRSRSGAGASRRRDCTKDRSVVRARPGCWGARKSFLDYVVKAIQDQPSFVVDYHDVQAKLSRHSAAHSFGLFVLQGDSDYEDGAPELDPTDVVAAAAAGPSS